MLLLSIQIIKSEKEEGMIYRNFKEAQQQRIGALRADLEERDRKIAELEKELEKYQPPTGVEEGLVLGPVKKRYEASGWFDNII